MVRVAFMMAVVLFVFSLSILTTDRARAALETSPHDATPSFQFNQAPVPFDGTWAGTIYFDKESFPDPSDMPPNGTAMRIEIHDAVVRVFMKENEKFSEVKAGVFHIAPVETNAVIFATNSDPGSWVETWTFAVTQKDDHTLLVEYSRVVNNVGVPTDSPGSRFGTRGGGEFTRLGP